MESKKKAPNEVLLEQLDLLECTVKTDHFKTIPSNNSKNIVSAPPPLLI